MSRSGTSVPWQLALWRLLRVGWVSPAGFHGSAFLPAVPRPCIWGGQGRPFEREEPFQIRNLPEVCGQRNSAVGAFHQSPFADGILLSN